MSTSGCSGARTMNVAPNSVSGRVVKTRSRSPPGWCSSGATSKSISAPSDRPIQFVCWMRMGSGQSMPVKSSSSSAYVVVRRNHCSRSRFSTSAPQRQQCRSDAFDLLARQRPVVGAPVDRRQRPIGEAGLHELQEQPLVPAVVRRIGGDDLLRPVERRAHRPELATHVLDVLHRPGERVPAALDGGVLGRQPEGIEPDREEHVDAVHPPETGERVARGDDVPVPDVQVARRVRIHGQQVVLGLVRVRQVGLVQPELIPALLPARLDDGRVVAFDTGARFGGHGSIVP